MSNDALEKEIQAKASTKSRVTFADVEDSIVSEHYFTAADGCAGHCSMAVKQEGWVQPLQLLTFCVLVLHNGFTVTGESACASPENLDAEIDRKVARAKAVEKIWPLLGFELKTRLHASKAPTTKG